MGIYAWSCCIFLPNFVQISLSNTDILAFYEIQYGRRSPSWICCKLLGKFVGPPTKAHSWRLYL